MLRFPHNKQSGMRVGGFTEPEETLVVAGTNGGLVTRYDPSNIEDSQFSGIVNAYIRNDRTGRRPGNTVYSSVNANKVLLLAEYPRYSGTSAIIRGTPTTIHSITSTGTTAIAGSLIGGAYDRFRSAVVNDRFFFTNNGANPVQEVNLTTNTFGNLGNAPNYKFITSFNNRILAANLGGGSTNPNQIGWSGNLNFAEWNPLTDPSAGYVSLIDSASDYLDPITGIFGFTETALMLRERSLWGISRQSSATNPFNFFAISPNIGCDCPYTAAQIHRGIAWFDLRTGNAYVYTVGMSAPESIGDPIQATLTSQISNTSIVFGSYNTVDDEYSILIPYENSSLVRIWTYSFRNKTWSYDERINISSASSFAYDSAPITIDQLAGTIDNLSGTIDNLQSAFANKNVRRFYGTTNGKILLENPTAITDNGGTEPYITTLTSKVYYIPRYSQYVTTLRFGYLPKTASAYDNTRYYGTFQVQYSKDGGITWTNFKTITWYDSDIGAHKIILCRKNIRASQFAWRIVGNNDLFELVDYELFIVKQKSETRSR